MREEITENATSESESDGQTTTKAGVSAVDVARGSAVLMAGRIAGNAGFFVAVLLLTRALDVSDRGEFAFITTAAQITARVASFGLQDAIAVLAAKSPERRAGLLASGLVVALVGSTVLSAAIAIALWATGGTERLGMTTSGLAWFVVGSIGSAFAGIGHAFLNGSGRWQRLALVTGATPWIYALLLAAAWATGPLDLTRSLSIWTAYFAIWAGSLLASSNRVVAVGRPSRRLIREMLGFGVRAWTGNVLALLNFRADQLVMGLMSGSAALGIYVVAVNASETLLILPEAAGFALVAMLAPRAGLSRAEAAAAAFRIVSIVTAVTLTVSALAAPFVLPAVFGSSYEASVVPFLLLALGSIGYVASHVFGTALLAASSPGLASLPPLAALTVGVGLDVILIPDYAARGAAAAAAISYVVGGLLATIACRRVVGFSLSDILPRPSDIRLIVKGTGETFRRARRRDLTPMAVGKHV